MPDAKTNKEIFNHRILNPIKWLAVFKLVVIILGAASLVAPAQPPSQKPVKITDTKPDREKKPLTEIFKNGIIKTSYQNKAGQIFKEVTTINGKHSETKNIKSVHPNGKEAEVEILTGEKENETKDDLDDDKIKLKTLQEIEKDPQGGEKNSTTYQKYVDGVPTEKIEIKNGGKPKTSVADGNGGWKPKENVGNNNNNNIKAKPGFDQCLVGRWVSESIAHFVTGGSGILLTIEKNGIMTVNYSGMQRAATAPQNDEVLLTFWTGSAVVELEPQYGEPRMFPGSILESSVSRHEGFKRKDEPESLTVTKENGGGGAAQGKYTCTKDTLVVDGILWITKYRRQLLLAQS